MDKPPPLRSIKTDADRVKFGTILSSLGGIVLVWNKIEKLAAYLLVLTIDRDNPKLPSVILTKHLSNYATLEMLKMFHKNRPSVSPHIEYITDAIDRLRIYRNYYVHGTIDVKGIEGTNKVVASMRDDRFNSKGIGFLESFIDDDEILSTLKGFDDLANYLQKVISILEENDFAQEGEQLASIQKPPLPQKPKKHLRFLGRDHYHDPA